MVCMTLRWRGMDSKFQYAREFVPVDAARTRTATRFATDLRPSTRIPAINDPEVVVEGDRFDWFERNGVDLATQDGNSSLLRPMNTSALAQRGRGSAPLRCPEMTNSQSNLISMWTPRKCYGPATTEIATDIWCSLSAASRTSSSAIFPASTQTMPRQAGSPRSAMAAAFSAQGFHSTLDRAPTFSMTMQRRHPRSSRTHCAERIEVDPVGLRPDGDERGSLRLAPSCFGL